MNPDSNARISSLIKSFNKKGMDLDLKRMNQALNLMGNPCKEIPAIQIAGTNGKGSIASFLESCLKEAEINIGSTTSPHLMNWSERIRINGEEIIEEEFISILKDIQLKKIFPTQSCLLGQIYHQSQN